MQGIFQKENTDKALKYGIYRHLPTYEKIIRNLVSFYNKKAIKKNKNKKRKILITTNAIRIMEAPPRFELGHKAFAELCLTTWLWCHIAKGFK